MFKLIKHPLKSVSCYLEKKDSLLIGADERERNFKYVENEINKGHFK